VITRTDAGTSQFNTSEIAGNAVAAGISNIYYPEAQRTVSDTMQKWGTQLALDTFFDELKEFWPDIRHKILKQQ
jgi:predicted component of type VI protein secretion system